MAEFMMDAGMQESNMEKQQFGKPMGLNTTQYGTVVNGSKSELNLIIS